MSEFDSKAVYSEMVKAAATAAGAEWASLQPWAEAQFKALSDLTAQVVEMRVKGELNDQKAKFHIQQHKNTAKIIVLTVEGIALATLESAWNAAVGVFRKAVLAAVGLTV